MSNQSLSQSYRIGYALSPKKVHTFIQPSLIAKATEQGIDLIRIDPNKPLIEQGPFDCIIHKLYGLDWIHQLQQYSSQYSEVTVIDSPESIERLNDRISMLEAVSHLSKNIFSVPKQVEVLETDILRGESSLKFPLIAKPLVVDGTDKSHQMYWIFDNEGLHILEAPIILQEFVNHGGVMFKVYVAGSRVKCVKRRSLPDISEEKLRSLKGYLPFSQISNSVDDDQAIDFERVEMPSDSYVVELAEVLREALGLNLFNFDLIRDARDNDRYLVIDINYLPGYTKLPCYESFLMDFFLNLAHKKSAAEGVSS